MINVIERRSIFEKREKRDDYLECFRKRYRSRSLFRRVLNREKDDADRDRYVRDIDRFEDLGSERVRERDRVREKSVSFERDDYVRGRGREREKDGRRRIK